MTFLCLKLPHCFDIARDTINMIPLYFPISPLSLPTSKKSQMANGFFRLYHRRRRHAVWFRELEREIRHFDIIMALSERVALFE